MIKQLQNLLLLNMNKKLTFIDLFAGIGGFRIGFQNNGFQNVWACDINYKCQEVYFQNFKDTPYADITTIHGFCSRTLRREAINTGSHIEPQPLTEEDNKTLILSDSSGGVPSPEKFLSINHCLIFSLSSIS